MQHWELDWSTFRQPMTDRVELLSPLSYKRYTAWDTDTDTDNSIVIPNLVWNTFFTVAGMPFQSIVTMLYNCQKDVGVGVWERTLRLCKFSCLFFSIYTSVYYYFKIGTDGVHNRSVAHLGILFRFAAECYLPRCCLFHVWKTYANGLRYHHHFVHIRNVYYLLHYHRRSVG